MMGETEHRQALPSGYELKGYRLLEVLGVGGFGVTYLAHDRTLERRVAVKEYLPNEFAMREGTTVHAKSASDGADFAWGLARFLDEARTLARFRHPNLVRVVEYFEANQTAYIVMEYEEGEALDRLLERHGRLTEGQLRRVLMPIVEGLGQVHEAGYLHRDIKPSNVFVRRSDESPVLLDFGAAREAMGRKSKSLTAIASAGYSPPEQYEGAGEQGPWTDIYALSALCYRAITGEAPTEAPRRLSRIARRQADPLPRLGEVGAEGYSTAFLEAVDAGLRVIAEERPPSLDAWLAVFEGARGEGGAGQEAAGGVAASGFAPGVGAEEARRTSRRRVWLAAAAAAGVVALAAVEELADGEGREEGASPDGSGEVRDAPPAEVAEAPRPVSPEPAPPAPVVGGRAMLVVETEPAGVEVRVAEILLGTTPLERADLHEGRHPVTLSHRDYQTMRLEGQVFVADRVLRIERRLVSGTGAVTVRVEPRGAWVEREGARLAEGTPVTLEGLPAGTVELTLGAAEHREARVRVEVPKDGVAVVDHVLERIAYGTLTLELRPPDAAVTVGDTGLAYRPGMRVPEGRHQLTVSRDGYAEATTTVEVSGATRERIELDLVVPAGPAGPAGMEFVRVPAGEFRMGSTSSEADSDEQPVTEVRISEGFWLGKYEVTQSEWEAVMGSNPSGFGGCGRCPVEQVSWEDVQEFIRGLNAQEGRDVYRLPTEAEWEYAARAGTTGDRYGNLDGIAWYDENSGDRTHPVGGKAANAWGLHDMLGNVWEWVHDWYGAYPGGTVTDPRGPGSGSYRVDRGCGWNISARSCRAPGRGFVPPGGRGARLGFRLLRTR